MKGATKMNSKIANEIDKFIDDMYESAYEGVKKITTEHNADLSAYDITICINGKSLILPFSSDIYAELEQYLLNCRTILDD